MDSADGQVAGDGGAATPPMPVSTGEAAKSTGSPARAEASPAESPEKQAAPAKESPTPERVAPDPEKPTPSKSSASRRGDRPSFPFELKDVRDKALPFDPMGVVPLSDEAPPIDDGFSIDIPVLSSASLHPLPVDEVGHWVNKLRAEGRVLFITSRDPMVLGWAMYSLRDQGFPRGVCRIRENQFTFDVLCADVTATESYPYVLFLDAFRVHRLAKDQAALNELLEEGNTRWPRLQQSLLQRNKYLVVLARQGDFDQALRSGSLFGASPHHWELPALEHRLLHCFPAADPAAARRLRTLLEAGGWGGDETALIRELIQLPNADALTQELQRWEALHEAGDWPPGRRPAGRAAGQEPASLRDGPAPVPAAIERLAPWIAAYMPELPADDYNEVLLEMLEEPASAPPPALPAEAPAAAAAATPGGAPAAAPQPPPLTLARQWHEDYATFMARLGLCFRPAATDGRISASGRSTPPVVAFSKAERAEVVKQIFEERLFLDHLRFVRRLRESGLLFHGSEEVVEAVIRISVELARTRPESFGRTWLVQLIRGAGPAREIESVELHHLDEDNVAVVVKEVPPQRWTLFYERVGRLLSTMYDHPALRTMVGTLLEEMLAAEQDELDEAVLAIARSMPKPTFDPVPWLRPLLTRESREIVGKARRQLAQLLTGKRMLSHLRTMRGWLPETGWNEQGERERLPPLGTVAGELFLDLVESSMTPPGRGTVGAHPPDNHLLRFLSESGSLAPEQVWIDWLFHPLCDQLLTGRLPVHFSGLISAWLLPQRLRAHLGDAVVQELEEQLFARWAERILLMTLELDGATGQQLFQALALADWAIVLQGVGRQPNEPGRAAVLRFAAQLAGIKERQRRRLFEYWSELEQSLLLVLERLGKTPPPATRAEVRDLKAVQEHLRGTRFRIRELRLQVIEQVRHRRRS